MLRLRRARARFALLAFVDGEQPIVVPVNVRAVDAERVVFRTAASGLLGGLDGRKVVHVTGKATAANACRGDDLQYEWRAPPKFDSFYIGFERYADSANDQNLWIDDVALSKSRVGCSKLKRGGNR